MNSSNFNDELKDFKDLKQILDYQLRHGILFFPQVQLFIEHKDPLNYELLAKKVKLPSVCLAGFRTEFSLHEYLFLSLGDDCTDDLREINNFDIVFLNCTTREYFKKLKKLERKNFRSIWFLVDTYHFEGPGSISVLRPEEKIEISQRLCIKKTLHLLSVKSILSYRRDNDIKKLIECLSN